MKEKTVILFDTAVASTNLGDQIIMESVDDVVKDLTKDAFVIRLPTHEYPGRASRSLLRHADLAIVGGTNLLSSNMNRYRQWKMNMWDSPPRTPIILLGVGWWQDQDNPNVFTRLFLANMLSKRYVHSVRDGYTLSKLKSIGFENVLNTACPTMWRLPLERIARTQRVKTDRVVTTLTVYRKSPEADRIMLQTLLKHYREVSFWPQQPGDLGYVESLDVRGLRILSPSLSAFDEALKDREADYCGTRLHAGIRALQHGRRSLIIGIDNRGREISADTGLPLVERAHVAQLDAMLPEPWPGNITLPVAAIARWKQSVRDALNEVDNGPH